MRPADTPESHLSALNDILYDAIEMPGISEARKVLLQQMRRWTDTVTVPPTRSNKPRAAFEAEIKAIRAFVDVDRRIRQSDPAALQEPYPGSGLYRTGKASETSGSPDA